MDWSEERTEFIRHQYLQARKSAGQIALMLGDVSREAVCGKLYRIGARRDPEQRLRVVLQAKPGLGAEPLKIAVKSKPRRGLSKAGGQAARAASEAAGELPSNAISLIETTQIHCRWIAGKKDGDWHVCGSAKARGAFCAVHAEIVYRGHGKQKTRCAGQPLMTEFAPQKLLT